VKVGMSNSDCAINLRLQCVVKKHNMMMHGLADFKRISFFTEYFTILWHCHKKETIDASISEDMK
jgi:hypothetical protein